MGFASKIKLKNGRLIHNLIRKRDVENSGTTWYANCTVHDIASAFSLVFRDSLLQKIRSFASIEGNSKVTYRWKQLPIEEQKKIIATLQLSCMYKSKWVPVHQLWSKYDGRPIFNAIFARNRFQETLRMLRFDNASERKQNRSLDKLQPKRKKFDLYPWFEIECW